MFLTKTSLLNALLLNKVQILAVDNDRDSITLYTALLESYGVGVTAAESIEEALDLLNWFVPDLLICEIRFMGESVDPLIQRVRAMSQNSYKVIPIFVISTLSARNLAQYLKVEVEAYQIKPIDLDQLVDEVWNLISLSNVTQAVNN